MSHQKSVKKDFLFEKSKKVLVSLLVLTFFISSFSASSVLGDTGHTWTVTIDKVNGQQSPFIVLVSPIHLEGTISSTNFVGEISQYQVQVDWGDGTIDATSNVQITQIGSNFIGTWNSNSDHTYASTGGYNVSVKLYHSQPPGVEASGDALYTITLPVIVGVNIGTSPQGLELMVDDKAYTAPFQANWVVGSQHNISVMQSQQIAQGIRYLWNNWSDGEGISHQVTIQNKDCLYTANFDTQFYLAITSDPDSIPVSWGTGWYAESSVVMLNAPMAGGFSFNYWDIDGIAQGVAVNPVSVQMNVPHTATAHYVSDPEVNPSPNPTLIPTPTPSPTIEPTPTVIPTPTPSSTETKSPTPGSTTISLISITFDQSGIGNDYNSTVLIVDGTSYDRNTLPVTFQWNKGSTHSFAYNSSLVINDKRYDWANATGLTTLQTGTLTPTASGTITAYYSLMCYLTVNAIGVNAPFTALVQIVASPLVKYDLTPTVSIEQWIAQNHQTTAAISTVNIIGQGDWAIFKAWTGRVEQNTPAVSFSMTSPTTLNAVFVKVNPVAESIVYSLTAGIATMITLSLINRRKPAQKSKYLRAIGTAAGITMVSIIVAAAVSAGAAIEYGIEVSKLLDFTNWAIIFTSIEAIVLLLTSTFIIRKVQPNITSF